MHATTTPAMASYIDIRTTADGVISLFFYDRVGAALVVAAIVAPYTLDQRYSRFAPFGFA